MRWKTWSIALLLFSTAAAGWSFDTWDQVALLSRFKHKVRQDLARVPDYTCLETIERAARGRGAEQFKISDTVRLEVSEVGGKELYAWPGGHFRDADLGHFVTGGIISTGEFADQARSLFVGDTGNMQLAGEEQLDGRRAVRYIFQVPQFLSKYRLKTPTGAATVATHGAFWFDPVTLDLLRLEVHASEIPPDLNLQEVVTRIHYLRVQGVANALLPERGELVLTKSSGEANRNMIQFSSCRQYQAESSISFAPVESAAEPAKAPARDVVLPAGLRVTVVLDTAIDPSSASVGDPIKAHVAEDLRDRGETLLPKDAVMSGRIRRLERLGGRPPFIVVAIELTRVEWNGAQAVFHGALVETGAFRGRLENLQSPADPGTGIIGLQAGKNHHIPAGLRMIWRTLYPKPS